MKEWNLTTQQLRQTAPELRVFDRVLLSGTIYTARDAAHKRFFALLDEGRPLPVDLTDAAIYYAGPTPAPEGRPIGSCGPTTSSRMDPYAPRLMDLGLVCMIGKGPRSQAVYDAVVRNRGVYLCALGGAGALAAASIEASEVVAFDDLGCESVKRLTVRDFPLVVAADCGGGNIFAAGRAGYLASHPAV
ncbi:FumA C-terminus/TtdB family hydratase beta subunit [Zongyangia hominis]|uniref:Fumarate hydratase C-terminal domain-containing protein n=1 Tax=Zongyangia hominis TaxID=2763677 RepID=A0A926EDA5_9FIRM|nr:FumA C-terminus/TtdB family hydratase beta subunit [Zongyangia hominis]MBC8570099.1 fumarate hydratase C-terminal domain-containing protein [Zongyangia hominis]